MAEQTRESLERHMAVLAADAFRTHQIISRTERSWILRRVVDGKPHWAYSAEVVALELGRLYVGGDIEPVLFGGGPADAIERVRWMGEHTHCGLRTYVAEKAAYGMGGERFVTHWDHEMAWADLRSFMKSRGGRISDPFALDDARQEAEQRPFITAAAKALGVDVIDVCRFGTELHPRVYYAHAALARLCMLLAQEKPEARHG